MAYFGGGSGSNYGGGKRFGRDGRDHRDDRSGRRRKDDRFGGGGRRFGGGGGGGSGEWGGRDRSFGGGKGGVNDGKRRNSDGKKNGPPPKKVRDDHNWPMEERHALMQSIFMEKKPADFEDGWVFVVCPPGKRRVLVSARDITQSYNNASAADLKFNSCLPSGSLIQNEMYKQEDLTILDTVYSPEKKKFFVVDMMHWKHYPYYDTESDFRFYCLEEKWSHLQAPEETGDYNEYPMELLPKHLCSNARIEEAMKNYEGKIEGLLFIRKNALYTCRDSANCLWMKLDNMEEILGITVPEGVSFATSNTKDVKRRAEQEERRKLHEARLAKREKKALEAMKDKDAAVKDSSEVSEKDGAAEKESHPEPSKDDKDSKDVGGGNADEDMEGEQRHQDNDDGGDHNGADSGKE